MLSGRGYREFIPKDQATRERRCGQGLSREGKENGKAIRHEG
jgi:hypothetical protein